jgi:DNA-binding transcriptional regulator LsrR (DeoR family)
MLSVVDALSHINQPEIKVVQATGGLGKLDSDAHAADLVRRAAQALGGKPYFIPAPGVVSSMSIRETLLADAQISDALALAEKSDIAIVGIGSPNSRSIVLDSGILTEEELKQLQDSGAVGDIVLRFFDVNGQPVHHEINERIIGLTLDHIKAIPCVIGVAGGALKFEVVRGALRNKLINVLVTDDELARRLLVDAEN